MVLQLNTSPLPFTSVAEYYVFMVLRVQNAGTHRTTQSRVVILDTVLTQQAGVVPLAAGSRSTLEANSAVLRRK